MSKGTSRYHVSLIVLVPVVAISLVAGAIGFAMQPGGGTVKASAAQAPTVVPLQVIGTTPSSKSGNVTPGTSITVDLSTSLAANSPLPSLTPTLPGAWTWISPDDLEFVAGGPITPGTTETLTIPGGTTGLLGSQGQLLTTSLAVAFTVSEGSTLRLQQLLAELGYLPVEFTPVTQPTSPQQLARTQVGTFSWRWANQPTELTSQWVPGTYGIITKGAVMSFESQHTLKVDGIAGPSVWHDLLQAAATGVTDPDPYGYVLVSKTLPETATVYQNGTNTYSTLANTGVPGTTTATGTFPVYSRFKVTTMSGTNGDGSHYVDPGIPWVSYFNGGDALHGFDRGSYGFPQSDGCVEMPPTHAAVVWPLTPIGTLVTVE